MILTFHAPTKVRTIEADIPLANVWEGESCARGPRSAVGDEWDRPDPSTPLQAMAGLELKEQFRALYKSVDPNNARTYINAWCTAALRSRIPAFRNLALRIRQTLRRQRRRSRVGPVEQSPRRHNARIRLINNRAHGHKTANALTASIYLSIGGITIKLATKVRRGTPVGE